MAETELWLIDLDKAAAALEALEVATPRLSQDTLRRLGEMQDETARHERRLAHIALRILLERRLGPGIRGAAFTTSATGKPSLATGETGFSLAHTQGLALIALGGDPLGVDIERMRKTRMPEVRRTPIEREAVTLAGGAALAGPDAEARFLNAWVRVEAAAKAHGSGVGPMLERLRPGRANPDQPMPPPKRGTPRVVVHDVPISGISGAVFAAVALAEGLNPPPLRVLPETASAITALVETP